MPGEKVLEANLRIGVKRLGGKAIKLLTPNHIPDRLVLLPNGTAHFVEVKSPGDKPRKGQLAMHALLRRMNFNVHVLDDDVKLRELLTTWKELIITDPCTSTRSEQ